MTRILYVSHKVFILKVMTHAEYDAQKWIEECGCLSPPPKRKRRQESKVPRRKTRRNRKGAHFTRNERDDYMSLVKRFPLTSIRSESELLAAQEVIDELLKAHRLKNGAIQYLDALSDLVMAYENMHHAIPAPSDAELLQHLMDAREVNQSNLHRATGIAISTISEILSGRRTFSKDVIAKLSRYFGVDKGLFAANF